MTLLEYETPDAGISASCVKCGRRREVPSLGKSRFPSRMNGELTVSADSACEQCGAQRVRIDIDFGPLEDPDPDDEDE